MGGASTRQRPARHPARHDARHDRAGGRVGNSMTHLVADGDLAATADDADAAADLFLEAGVCVFEAALPPSLVAACRSVLERKSRLLDERLAARGVDLQAPWRFNEVCRRRFARYDLRGWALADAIFTESLLLWSAAPWLPFVRSVLGDVVPDDDDAAARFSFAFFPRRRRRGWSFVPFVSIDTMVALLPWYVAGCRATNCTS